HADSRLRRRESGPAADAARRRACRRRKALAGRKHTRNTTAAGFGRPTFSTPFAGDVTTPMTALQQHSALSMGIPFALVCGVLAIAYGAALIVWVLRQAAGS